MSPLSTRPEPTDADLTLYDVLGAISDLSMPIP